MAYDFSRPFIDSSEIPTYKAIDLDEARLYGKTVRAIEMSNAEYETWMPGHIFEEIYVASSPATR